MVNNVVSIPVAASLAASGLRSMAKRPAATNKPKTAAAATYQLRLLWRKPTVPDDDRSGEGTLTQAERSNFSISPSAVENALAIEFKIPPPTAPAAAAGGVAHHRADRTGDRTRRRDDGHHTPPQSTKPTGEATICWLGESVPLGWSTSCQSVPSQVTLSVLTWYVPSGRAVSNWITAFELV